MNSTLRHPALKSAPSESRHPDDHLRTWMHEGLHDLPADAAVLAVGCGEAFLAPHLQDYSTNVTVLDTCADQLAQLARRFPDISFLQHHPSHALPFAPETFEAIWCCEFLDRVFAPEAALRELHRVLAPGGRLILTVPDRGSASDKHGADDHGETANPRIRDFTRRTLVELARRAGFMELHTVVRGSARGRVGAGVTRSLRLSARKDPAARFVAVPNEPAPARLGLVEEFSFASRPRRRAA